DLATRFTVLATAYAVSEHLALCRVCPLKAAKVKYTLGSRYAAITSDAGPINGDNHGRGGQSATFNYRLHHSKCRSQSASCALLKSVKCRDGAGRACSPFQRCAHLLGLD